MATFGVNAAAPAGLSPFSRQVFDVMAKYTAFTWPILTAQCRRASVDPMHLDKESLLKVIPFITEGVGAFSTPEKASRVGAALWRLASSS
jgi:hypothetical protein